MTLPDDTKPSEAIKAAEPIVAILAHAYGSRDAWGKHIALALDRFRAAGVREERERCFQWAIGRRSRSSAAQAIREGFDPNGHPRDPSLCWRCGVTLHPGHDCSGASP